MDPIRRAMLVEDSPTQAQVWRGLLEKEGLDVVHVPSAEAALERVQTVLPSLIVLDYHLPGMNGDDFCREIRLNVNTRAIPILMLTVERSDAAQMRGLESGADDYLPKTADPDIIRARVRTLLRKSNTAPVILDIEHRFNRARLLAIDDSPTYLHYLARELASEHYVIETALSGEDGLRLIEAQTFDCVVVDFEMPGMKGTEVCRKIEERRTAAGLPVIVILLTSHDDKEHLTQGLEAGADDYVSKSADIGVIKVRIRALLRRKFLLEENRRILDELKEKELRAVRARADQEAAEVRASMADRLAAANRELQNANRQLEEALHVTKAITEHAAEGLFMVDGEERVNFVNPAGEEMFGFSAGELMGRRFHDLIHRPPGDAADSPYPLTQSLASGEAITSYDEVLLRKDGAAVDVVCSIAPIVRQGRTNAAVLVLHDVSERKRAEERLRQSQKLESIGLLAGGIAHDFNNLLTGILGSASLALECVPPGSSTASLLEDVVGAGERAAHLTRQMLAYSGKGRFLIEPVDLSALTVDIVRLVQASISKNVAVHLDLARNPPPVEADAGQMQQVVMNLLLNAAESIGDGPGMVLLRTGVQQVDIAYIERELEHADLEPGTYICLEVRDTGCGMDDATKSKIFDPFFTTKFTGRGLGLAAVAGIVRGHKGAIKVSSRPGKGSTFLVLFPTAFASRPPVARPPLEAKQAPLAPAQPVNAGEREVVLVVDDEDVVLRAAKLALSRHGFSVLLAESGRAAVQVLEKEKNHVSLVLLDLSMPGMSGSETLPELRKIRPDIEVIVSSGYSEDETRRLFSGQTISGFIQKPYTASALAARVKSVLQADRA